MKRLSLQRWGWVLLCLSLCLGLAGCTSGRPVTGRLIIWHTWDEAEAPILEQVLADFQQLHPDIQLSVERKAYDTVLNEFAAASSAGLGPDVLIGIETVFAHRLYDSGFLANLDETAVDWTVFERSTLQAVQRGADVRIGVPLNAYVNVMFYNRSLIEDVPQSFEALQTVSENGRKVGLPARFYFSYWGIGGLDGSVFEGNELAETSATGIQNWLEWLVAFQQTPGAVLSPDTGALADSFARGDLALLVADSLKLATFEEQLGSEQLGVVTIPNFPAAQPFSNVELMVVNSASVQLEAAARLSNFMSNEAQQRKLARTTSGRVPVNRSVTLNPTLFPRVSVILEQNQAAVVPTKQQDDWLNLLITAADPVYQLVLEGIVTPEEGAEMIVDEVIREAGQ